MSITVLLLFYILVTLLFQFYLANLIKMNLVFSSTCKLATYGGLCLPFGELRDESSQSYYGKSMNMDERTNSVRLFVRPMFVRSSNFFLKISGLNGQILTKTVLKPSSCHKESIEILNIQIQPKLRDQIAFGRGRTNKRTWTVANFNIDFHNILKNSKSF